LQTAVGGAWGGLGDPLPMLQF